jgi:glycosyltransferase involved in cell wall biosynthesis
MLLDTYKPYISGVTNHVSLTKRFLENAGHEVFVFTFGGEDYEDDEPNVLRSPGMPLVDTGFYVSFRYSSQAQRLLRTMDVVHVHHPFLSGRLAIRYCQPRGIPIVFTNHTRFDLYVRAYLPIFADELGETFLRAYLPSFCRTCDLVIAPSNGLKQVLERIGVDSGISVVPNGVDLSRFQRVIAPVERSQFGFQPEDTVLVYLGRLGPEKNLPFLLRAFSGLAGTYPNVRLLLIGDGPERENLQDRVRHMELEAMVHFTGMLPYEQVPAYLAACDAFVTASVTEVHPLSVIEALAAGLPVLGINSPGVGDTVEDGVTGLLAQSEDLAAFTAKMVRLVVETQARQAMRQNALQVVEKYDIRRTTQHLLSHYQQVVAHAAPRKRSWRSRLVRLSDQWRP